MGVVAECGMADQKKLVVREILDTETRYLDSLLIIRDQFLIPLTNEANGLHPILKPKEVSSMFLNIDDIILVSTELHKNLHTRIEEEKSVMVGDIFLRLLWGFTLYRKYVAEYELALNTLKELEERPRFAQFLQEALKDPKTKSQTLESYLIMPVQRIPRYKLLVAEAFKNTAEEDADYKDLKEALGKIEEVAKFVNEEIRKRENTEKLRELSRRFGIELHKPGRIYLREGFLTKICRKAHKRYTFVLFNDLLLYKSEQDVKAKPRTISLCGFQDAPDRERYSNAVQLSSNSKSFIVYAEDAASKKLWLEALAKAVPETAAAGSAAAPVWEHDQDYKNCLLCQTKFTLLFRKHHCRNCGKLVCSKCSNNKFDLAISDGKNSRVCDPCFRNLSGGMSPNPDAPPPPDTPTSSSTLRRTQSAAPPQNPKSPLPATAAGSHSSLGAADTADMVSQLSVSPQTPAPPKDEDSDDDNISVPTLAMGEC